MSGKQERNTKTYEQQMAVSESTVRMDFDAYSVFTIAYEEAR